MRIGTPGRASASPDTHLSGLDLILAALLCALPERRYSLVTSVSYTAFGIDFVFYNDRFVFHADNAAYTFIHAYTFPMTHTKYSTPTTASMMGAKAPHFAGRPLSAA